VVSQEIVWLANPEIRASKPSDDAEPLSYDQVINAIKRAEPLVIVQSIIRPDESHFALSVTLSYPDGRSVEVYVNPYTGAIQGISPASTSNNSPAPCTAGGWCHSPMGSVGAGTWSPRSACRCWRR